MELLNKLQTLVTSVPLIMVLFVGVFTIAALVYNAKEVRTFEQEQENNLVLTILGAMLILGLMIVTTQV